MAGRSEANIGKLQTLVERLRAPDGCPWDQEQTLADLRAYVVEEAHEVAAAIDGGEAEELRGELGDLLFQVVFASRLAEEDGQFDLAQVIDGIHGKMIDRHPHVFGEESLGDSDAVRRSWEERKLREEKPRTSMLDGIPRSLPALTASYRMTQKVAGVGFDWSDPQEVLEKIREELAEVEEALESSSDDKVFEELGDLLFAVSNLARFLKLDPEGALAAANLKFRRRFQAVERNLAARDRSLVEASLEEMDREWDRVKEQEGTT